MGLEGLGKTVQHCPPVIAQGAEPTIQTRLALKDAVAEWRRLHRPANDDQPQKAKTKRNPAVRGASAPKAYDTLIKYTFVGQQNHRRPGTMGAAFIDWLMANPRATEASIKVSGHDLKHLRWDLRYNREVLKLERD
jgi:hypothetical protein